MKKKTVRAKMLPHKSKAIGLLIAAVALLLIVAATVGGGRGWFPTGAGRFLTEFAKSLMIIGLLVAALARERQEDEMMKEFRLTATYLAFSFCVLIVAIRPLVFFADDGGGDMTAWEAVGAMLLFYHMIFWIMKRRARNEEHD